MLYRAFFIHAQKSEGQKIKAKIHSNTSPRYFDIRIPK